MQACMLAPELGARQRSQARAVRPAQGSNVFAGKHGFITPRDLFKWGARGAVGYQELAENGFLLLGERLRQSAERAEVQAVLEATMNVKVRRPCSKAPASEQGRLPGALLFLCARLRQPSVTGWPASDQ